MTPSYPPDAKHPTSEKWSSSAPFFKPRRHVIQQLWWMTLVVKSLGLGLSCFHRRIALSFPCIPYSSTYLTSRSHEIAIFVI